MTKTPARAAGAETMARALVGQKRALEQKERAMARTRKTDKAVSGDGHPLQRYLAVPVAEATEAQLAFAEKLREHEAHRLSLHRRIMEWLETPKVCPRRACRRAGKCTSPTVVCYEAALPWLQEHILPDLRAAILARRGRGDA